MLIILRRRFLKPNALNLNSFTPKLLILHSKSPISTFCSLESSNLSESKPNLTSERVISLFRSHGFSEIQISKLTRVRPNIVFADPQKTLAPKIEFLLSIGISKTLLPKIVSANPVLLWRSLENQLIPCHNYLKSVLIDDENVVKMLMRGSRILLHDVETKIAPNISLLTRIGVPKSLLLFMLLQCPTVAHENHDKLERTVEEAIGMGFNPTKTVFVNALQVLSELNKTTWDRKCMVYRSWGLSDDEIRRVFRSRPLAMSLSEEKIMRGMDIFVNKMGREAAEVARCPSVLAYNLENRIIPRCRVIKILLSKGILKKRMSLSTFLNIRETIFVEKFVSKYEDEVPGLLNIYRDFERNKVFE